MPSACALGIIQGNITLDFGRTERLRAFRSTIFTRRVAMVNCICSAASFGSAALRSALLFAFTASPVKKWFRATRRAFPIIFMQKARRASLHGGLWFTVYSALVSGFASALASGFAAGAAAGAAGFTTGFGGLGSSFSGNRMMCLGHFWAHIPQPLHLS